MSREHEVDFVLRTVEKRDIRFVRLWFTDVLGNLKSFAISPEDLEEVFEEGIGFDASAIDGFASTEESDMLAIPDPSTFQILPWRPNRSGVARIFCDIKTPEREPYEGDSRGCLKRVFRAADKLGYVLNVGPQIEYFYFANDKDPIPLDDAGYFDLISSDYAQDLRRDTTLTLEKMSVPVEYSFHALAPSQNGVALRHAEAVSCADNIITARLAIKEVAFSNNLFASFMPKPLTDAPGSAMFLHESLFDHDGENLFWDSTDDLKLSDLAKSYIAGLLAYAPEYTLITNPTVNSYKRLRPNGQVPVYATWGRRNRSVLVRVPMYKPGKNLSRRVELRSPDPTSNPYLAIAATLAAGLKGIEQGLTLPDEFTPQDMNATPQEFEKRGYQPLPRNLGEAISNFEASSFMRETLGDHIFDYLVKEKRREWDSYCTTVTDWERAHYYAGF